VDWSSQQYSKFETERNRPIIDLLQQLPTTAVRTAIDIGCGPGNSTELLSARYPDAEVRGMDSSPEMIDAARLRLPSVSFDVADISTWSDPGPFDVIFANAALQWVPDHDALLPKLLARLAPGGSLAVQMPDNLSEPSHLLMRQVALDGPWDGRLDRAWESWANRRSADWYFYKLRGEAVKADIWRTTYFHPLTGGPAAIVDWFKGTALGPFLALLEPTERTVFLANYEAAISLAYPASSDGIVLLAIPRLFFVATRTGP
jgi:trans-aconitate 2-methyltransferase